MYIIGKNKDYYDGVVGSMGIDKTLIYERKTEEIIDKKLFPNEFQKSKGFQHSYFDVNPILNARHAEVDTKKTKKYHLSDMFLVGFCGKIYLGWKCYYKTQEIGYLGYPEDVIKTDIIYGYENMKDILNDNYWRSNLDDDIKYILSYDWMQVFRDIHSPVFVFDFIVRGDGKWRRTDNKFVINPILKEYEFYKVFDSFQAFQEISMFLGGVLGSGEKEIIEVADKYKIEQHGFDKMSFRKEGKKKR